MAEGEAVAFHLAQGLSIESAAEGVMALEYWEQRG